MKCQYCQTKMQEPKKGLYRCLNCAAEFVTPEYRAQQEKFFEPYFQQQTKRTRKQNIPYSFKWAVWKRDNFTCQICGSRDSLTVDHIYPESKGGELTMENVQTLCNVCNSRKGAR